MARDAITVTALNENSGTVEPAGTAIGTTNDGKVSGYPLDEIVLRVDVGSSNQTTATVIAGDYPPALSSGQGDFATSITSASNPTWLGPFEGARFTQSDGDLHLDVTTTCTVTAFHVPSRF